jgi:hypothetical protein
MPNGPQKITGLAFDPTTCQSEHSITDEEVKKLLSSSTKAKKPNKKKKSPGDATTKVSSFILYEYLLYAHTLPVIC